MITNIGRLLTVAVFAEVYVIAIGKWRLGILGVLTGTRAEEMP